MVTLQIPLSAEVKTLLQNVKTTMYRESYKVCALIYMHIILNINTTHHLVAENHEGLEDIEKV